MATSNFNLQFGIAKCNTTTGDVLTLSGSRNNVPVEESIQEILEINEQLGELYPDFCDLQSFYLTPQIQGSCQEKENPAEKVPI